MCRRHRRTPARTPRRRPPTTSHGRHAWQKPANARRRGTLTFVAAFQPDAHFGRVLAAYGGVFIAGSLIWGMVADGFRPDRWDVVGAAVCLVGVVLIMYAPR